MPIYHAVSTEVEELRVPSQVGEQTNLVNSPHVLEANWSGPIPRGGCANTQTDDGGLEIFECDISHMLADEPGK